MPPKKRGRKPSKKKAKDNTPKVHKKRGRKPKGGKIVPNINSKIQTEEVKKPNIILQLKCSSSDIDDINNSIDVSKYQDTSIKSYNIEKSVKQKNKINYQEYNTITYKKSFKNESKEDNNSSEQNKVELKVIWDKLKTLKLKLHLNEMADKRSSCFWCTCQFSNPAVYIPKQQRNNITEVYGCFCSPECAVAYLKNEPIDSSTLWERYALLNNIYGKIYDYSKNIKPAPNPYYTLDKFYGNLSIQEYRKLLSKDRLLLVVEKPLTKIMPELYEENHELPNIFNNELENTKNRPKYRLQRKKQSNTKSSILTNNFGIN
jgi:hypothetical protein